MNGHLKLSWQPDLKSSSLLIGWRSDASGLGTRVIEYLIGKLGGRSFCEIEPIDFFSLGGVTVDSDVVQFPESKFYACSNDLVVFDSAVPSSDWHTFLNLIVDVARQYCRAREVYTVGGMLSLGAHTAPRELLGTFNSLELKELLSRYKISAGLDYETPPGQRPTLSSFLLWAARKRNLPAASLWVPIPFYMVTVEDFRAEKIALEFFNERFNLGIDFSDLDREIESQNAKLAQARSAFPAIDECISKLESNMMLSDEENQKLIEKIVELFREKGR